VRAESSITLLTGGIQTGKTNLCLEVVAAAKDKGVQLGGLVSPGVFQDGEKTAIDVLDIKSGERVRLADRTDGSRSGISTQRWTFLPESVAWGNEVLKRSVPCDLLLIDELGPLEFLRREGWTTGFETVASGGYQSALLVIRPSLLEEASKRWRVREIIDLDDQKELPQTGTDLFNFLIKSWG
jgi:nucleoside-triphosphatase THEP1